MNELSEQLFFSRFLGAWLALAAILFFVLFRISAPYGRHTREGWGPTISSRLGWILMEAPSPILMTVCFIAGNRQGNLAAQILLGLWLLHYINRSFIFPLRMRGGDKPMPLFTVVSAFFFNLVNGYLNGRWLFTFGPVRGAEWLADPRFFVGVALFIAGLLINLRADETLRRLRAPGETGYKIPRGGLYEFVSCPNYLGELIEWTGFALAAFSLPALTFALWTFANLVPRALTNHRWYHERFPDYPPERRAIIPRLL